jgi:hypothetical protein
MICRRPGTTTFRVGSAVGLLLTLSSFLAWKVAFASSAEGTATASGSADTASFDRDVVVSSPGNVAALARDLDLGAEDADSSLSAKRHRSLQTSIAIRGDTTGAPLSSGNNNTKCAALTDCINGCHSRFYKVTGGTDGGYIYADTCGTASVAHRVYAWKGSGSVCSTFACTGTFAVCLGWVGLGWVGLVWVVPWMVSHVAF